MKSATLRTFVSHASPIRLRTLFAGFFTAAALLTFVAQPTFADVVGEGDVTPSGPDDLPINGGTVDSGGGTGTDSTIIVGGSGVPNIDDTTVGILSIDVPAFTLPLISDFGYLGFNVDGIGLATVAGRFSEWRMNQSLTVGVDGQGFLEITGGAIVRTDFTEAGANDFDAYFSVDDDNSEEGGGQGFATISGLGSQMQNTDLAVGFHGYGQIDVAARATLLTRELASIGVEVLGADDAVGTGYVSVDGAGTRWLVGETGTTGTNFDGELRVGEAGRGTLVVRNGGLVQVETDTSIGFAPGSVGQVTVTGQNSSLVTLENLVVGNAPGTSIGELYIDNQASVRTDGTTSIGNRGLLDLGGGSIQTTSITNSGTIRGDGRIEAATVVNNGDIRNAASVSNLRERLLFTGAVTNNDNIESVGGEIEFQGLVTNNDEIIGIDAILRFYGDITGGGRLFLDNTLMYTLAPVTSNALLSVSGGDPSTVIGGLNFGGSSLFAIEVGNAPSRLDVSDVVTLSGDIEVELAAGYVPVDGDSFEVIRGVNTGTFDDVLSPDTIAGGFGGSWIASTDGNSVFVTYDADLAPNLNPGDDDGDGDVDGNDFLVWQRQVPAVGQAELDDIKNNFGATSTVAAGAIPEPSAYALAMFAATIGGWAARRRK